MAIPTSPYGGWGLGTQYTRRISCKATCSYVDSCFQKHIIDDGDTSTLCEQAWSRARNEPGTSLERAKTSPERGGNEPGAGPGTHRSSLPDPVTVTLLFPITAPNLSGRRAQAVPIAVPSQPRSMCPAGWPRPVMLNRSCFLCASTCALDPQLLAEVLPRTVAVLRNGSWAELSYENVETMATELGDLGRTALRRLTEVSNTTSDSHSPLVDNVVFIANSFKTIVWSQLTPYVVPIMSSVVNTVMSTVAQAILFFSTFVFLVRSRRRVSRLPPSATADANRERAAGRVCATRLQITSKRTVVRHAVNIIIGPRHLDLCDIAEKMLTQVRTAT